MIPSPPHVPISQPVDGQLTVVLLLERKFHKLLTQHDVVCILCGPVLWMVGQVNGVNVKDSRNRIDDHIWPNDVE